MKCTVFVSVSERCIYKWCRRDDRLTVVLWGKFANDIDDAIQGSNGQSVIFVLRFGKIKVWKGTN